MGFKALFVISGLIVFISVAGVPAQSGAQVRVQIDIGPPPVYHVAGPPPVVVIPGTYVYMVPDIGVEILFYQGYWYRPHEGHWFRAKSYNGPWKYLPPERIPGPLLHLPPEYGRVPPGYHRIPYGQFKKSWAKWGRERHWDNDRAWREGWHTEPGGPGRDGKGMPPGQERREGGERRGGEEHGRGHYEHGGR